MAARGWRELDVLLVTGDAYFDHPSHGAAVIGRVLEDAGYRVGIAARPDWRSTRDFEAMGRPLLFAGVTAGAVDSTLNNFTADLKRRRDDAYAPGGEGMGRPENATLVYSNRIREAFPGLPVVLGGIEASTRRFAYFEYRSSRIRRSILVDSRAALLVWGPGESQALEVARRLGSSEPLSGIPGTALLTREPPAGRVTLPPFDSVRDDPLALLEQTRIAERISGTLGGEPTVQEYEEGFVVCEPAAEQETGDLDRIHSLPFTRTAHPSYDRPIPALETVRWSVISHRGCPGGCSFCALSYHQGRRSVPRSASSILEEIRALAARPDFKGVVSDIGGPTANAYGLSPLDPKRCEGCGRPSCLFPKICSNLETDHLALLDLLEDSSRITGVDRILLASGIRHDLALLSPDFVERVTSRHTGGHLKVAPEHASSRVLSLMRKPPLKQLEEFERIFLKLSSKYQLKQYLVPYFIAGFPGCTPKDGDLVGAWLSSRGQKLRQVQTFIPLPGTLAAAMFASRTGPGGERLFVADDRERKRQKSVLLDPGGRRRGRPSRRQRRRGGG